MKDNFMKEQPVFHLIVSMALPMVLSMLVNSLYNIIDSFFIAKIGSDAITALSLIYPVQNLVNAAAIGFGVGINAVAAYHLGAGDKDSANAAVTCGLMLSAVHGVLAAVGSICVMPHFLRMFTSSDTVIHLGLQYSFIVFPFSLVLMTSLAFEKIFQSVGRMRVTMMSLLCGCIANIILDPLLIFGIGILPAMGIRGAALATGIGQTVTLVIYLAVYRMCRLPVSISPGYLASGKRICLRLYAVGIPAALNLALPSLLISCLNGLLSLYSGSYVVILGIYYKLQTFLYLPANGIVQGIRPVIGYNFGAGEHKRVRQIYKLTLCMTAAIMAAGTIICLTASEWLIGLFINDPQTIQDGRTALRIISAGFIVSAVSVTTSGALEGLGKGTPSLIISLFRYVLVILPAALVLCRSRGPEGVWNTFWITELVTAAVSAAVYRKAVRLK